ncbi:MAG: hypothetical protein JXR64_00055 [Spirochaetales bacterium]|nr:hypothetical protein [Spirochaetales bacterium]
MKKVLLVIVASLLFSCDIPYIENSYNSDKITSFNYLVDQFDNHYVYTEYKNIDIEQLRSKYLNQISNEMLDEDYFTVLSNFINEFKDGHSNIFAPFGNSSAYSTILNESSEEFNPNFDWRLIKFSYLNGDDILGNSLRNGIIETSEGKYGYIYYSSFMDTISTYEIETVLDRFERNSVKGIILDIRSNGGGSLANMITLVSYFGYDKDSNSKEIVKTWRRDSKLKYTKVRNLEISLGLNIPFTVVRNPKSYTGPVALLTNRGSYSAASFTPTAFKAFNNVKQIGAKTGGGMGLPIGGTMPNGWRYRFSSNIVMDYRAISYDENQWNYENGVPVDVGYEVDDNPLTTDKDEIIDKAIEWINSYN